MILLALLTNTAAMLTTLHVSDFAIIDHLELDIDSGFTVISGETGAGKSILFDALGLLLGQRADSSLVRTGAERAEVSASFSLRRQAEPRRWLDERELQSDEELLLRRTVTQDGRSRAYINGSPATLQQLSELGAMLVAIHGQHAHQSLLRPAEQLALLDDSGIEPQQLAAMAAAHGLWRQEQQRLDELNEQDVDAAQLELLRFQVDELSAVEKAANNYDTLSAEHLRLSRAGELLALTQDGQQRLDGDDDSSVLAHLQALLHQLDALAKVDPQLGEVQNMLREARINVEESLSLLHHYADQLELDPDDLRQRDEQLAQLHQLARKYRCRPQQLGEQLEQLRERCDTLAHLDVKLEQQSKRVAEQRQAALAQAAQLSQARAELAATLARRCQKLLRQLGMPQARFQIQLQRLEDQRCTALGLDQCEFLFSANPGVAPAPLRKIASGGELSRVALALMVAARQRGGPMTLLFDEVDAGVGGETAKTVGNLLARVADKRQALCVTHLAQVAAAADHHLCVTKVSQRNKTHTEWQRLNASRREQELARMLGGAESAAARAHAAELLAARHSEE